MLVGSALSPSFSSLQLVWMLVVAKTFLFLQQSGSVSICMNSVMMNCVDAVLILAVCTDPVLLMLDSKWFVGKGLCEELDSLCWIQLTVDGLICLKFSSANC